MGESPTKKSNYTRRIDHLFENGRVRMYPKNQLIHYEGDPLTHIYLIRKGFVKAYTILDSGDTRTMMLLGAGDIFPLAFSESMDWENYKIRYFYQSLADAELMALPSQTLRQNIDKDNDMLITYMSYLSASNEAIMNQLQVMKNKKAIDKVGMLLPYLISTAGRQLKPDIYQIELKLSHQEIADLSGVTRETTTTLIKQLEKDGIIDQSRALWRINTKNLQKVLGSK